MQDEKKSELFPTAPELIGIGFYLFHSIAEVIKEGIERKIKE